MSSSSNDFASRSDQWDIRVNFDNKSQYLHYVDGLDRITQLNSIKYLHCSGLEMGDVPGRSSFGKLHAHLALVLNNATSKRSIVTKFTQKGHGYYVEPRDKSKPIDGWINYHSKIRTKVDPQVLLPYVYGSLPSTRKKRKIGEETEMEKWKREKRAEEWARKKYLMQTSAWDEMDQEFPGFIYSSMGQSMKREVLKQANDEYNQPLKGKLNNYIIWGGSGTGKSSSVALLYPNCYKKQKGSQYWDAYDKTNPDHKVVWIDEMSKETLATFSGKKDGGFEFLKELADRYPVTVDEKYTKGYKIRPSQIIITMNEHPTSLLPDRAVEVNRQALYRKFQVLHVSDWLALNGLRNHSTGAQRIAISEFAAEEKELNEFIHATNNPNPQSVSSGPRENNDQ